MPYHVRDFGEDPARSSILGMLRLVGPILLGCLCGCAKFKASEEPNLAPFANFTASLMADTDFSFAQDQTVLLRGVAADDPRILEIIRTQDRINDLMRSILDYSAEMVRIGESGMTGPEKCQALADMVERLLLQRDDRQGFEDFALNRDEAMVTIDAIRKQTKLLSGLRELQDLIYAAVLEGEELLDRIKVLEAEIDYLLEQHIDEQAEPILALRDALLRERRDIAGLMHDLQTWALGDAQALERIGQTSTLQRYWPQELNSDNAAVLEETLVQRLEFIERTEQQLRPTLHLYERAHLELDAIVDWHDEEIRQMRRALISWGLVHNELAKGRVTPADWYDLSVLPSDVFRAARKSATGTRYQVNLQGQSSEDMRAMFDSGEDRAR